MIRILSIQPVAETGGSDRAQLRMVRALDGGQFHVDIVVPSEPPLRAELEAAGATIHIVPMRRITSQEGMSWWAKYAWEWNGTVRKLTQLAESLGTDVVHSNSLHSWYGWRVAEKIDRPHVWHAREITVQSEAARKLEATLAKRSDAVIAMSQAIAEQLEQTNVTVIVDDVDPDEFGPHHAGRFRPKHGFADETVLVGAAGRLDTWKGFDLLLDAWRTVGGQPGVELLIAGGPVAGKESYAEELEAKAAMQETAHMLGPIDDMPGFYADLDVFVLPSSEPEPFGLVVIEALASGVPVIATNHGGPPELLADHPERGRLAPPKNAAMLAEVLRSEVGIRTAALDDGPRTSTELRASRSRLWSPTNPDYGAVFSGVVRA